MTLKLGLVSLITLGSLGAAGTVLFKNYPEIFGDSVKSSGKEGKEIDSTKQEKIDSLTTELVVFNETSKQFTHKSPSGPGVSVEENFTFPVGNKANYLVTELVNPQPENNLTPKQLYAGNVKKFKCRLTHASRGEENSKLTVDDPSCQIYLIHDSTKVHAQYPEEFPDVKTEEKLFYFAREKFKITQKDQLKAFDSKLYYQIILRDGVLQKFKSAGYEDIKIELVSNDDTEESLEKKYILFDSNIKNVSENVNSATRVSETASKLIKHVVVKVLENTLSSSSLFQNDFLLEENKGYKMSLMGAELAKKSSVSNEELNKCLEGQKTEFSVSEISAEQHYVLSSPDGFAFYSNGFQDKEIILKCSDNGCSGNLKIMIEKVLENIFSDKND